MARRIVHENPFSDRINDYVQEQGFSMYQLQETILDIIRNGSADLVESIFTDCSGYIEVDTEKVIWEMRERYGGLA